MSNKKPTSVLETLHEDYGLLAEEQDPAKITDVLRRIADGIEKGEIAPLGFTYGFTAHVEGTGGAPRAVIDVDFIETKVIEDRRAEVPEKPEA